MSAIEAVNRVDVPKPRLTKQQRKVLAMLDSGLTLRQISTRLQVNERSARDHARLMRRALGAETNAQAVGIGHRQGILSADGGTK